jgi:hypothetical protein
LFSPSVFLPESFTPSAEFSLSRVLCFVGPLYLRVSWVVAPSVLNYLFSLSQHLKFTS